MPPISQASSHEERLDTLRAERNRAATEAQRLEATGHLRRAEHFWQKVADVDDELAKLARTHAQADLERRFHVLRRMAGARVSTLRSAADAGHECRAYRASCALDRCERGLVRLAQAVKGLEEVGAIYYALKFDPEVHELHATVMCEAFRLEQAGHIEAATRQFERADGIAEAALRALQEEEESA